MKLIVLMSLVAVALAAPKPRDYKVQLVSYDNDNIGLGNYHYGFSQSDGTRQEQHGELRNGNSLVVRGSFSWVAPNGHTYTVNYVADDHGYQPEVEEAPPGIDPILLGSLLG